MLTTRAPRWQRMSKLAAWANAMKHWAFAAEAAFWGITVAQKPIRLHQTTTAVEPVSTLQCLLWTWTELNEPFIEWFRSPFSLQNSRAWAPMLAWPKMKPNQMLKPYNIKTPVKLVQMHFLMNFFSSKSMIFWDFDFVVAGFPFCSGRLCNGPVRLLFPGVSFCRRGSIHQSSRVHPNSLQTQNPWSFFPHFLTKSCESFKEFGPKWANRKNQLQTLCSML